MTKHAYVFPGQGSQYPGMARDLYEGSPKAKEMMEYANEALGFRITDIMFGEDAEALKDTKVTQPAIFLHSTVMAACMKDFRPDMVAGHSLGELCALVAAGALTFEDGLRLVNNRAQAMQKACEMNKGAMAAILRLDAWTIEKQCEIIERMVVAANYNCPGQIVISGEVEAVEEACIKLKEAGAKRAVILPVGGAFHSPLMRPAREEFAAGIEQVEFHEPICPVYQNVSSRPVTDPVMLKTNLFRQLTHPVRWMQSVEAMISDGCGEFTEVGPGAVLQGLIMKIAYPEHPDIIINSALSV